MMRLQKSTVPFQHHHDFMLLFFLVALILTNKQFVLKILNGFLFL